MQSAFALTVALELLLPPLAVFLLALTGVRVLRRFLPESALAQLRWSLVIWLSTAQFLVYLAVWSLSFQFGEARGTIPWPLGLAIMILSAPVMYLQSSLLPLFAWLGGGTVLLIGLASLNAMLWGIALAAVTTWLRGRQHAA